MESKEILGGIREKYLLFSLLCIYSYSYLLFLTSVSHLLFIGSDINFKVFSFKMYQFE